MFLLVKYNLQDATKVCIMDQALIWGHGDIGRKNERIHFFFTQWSWAVVVIVVQPCIYIFSIYLTYVSLDRILSIVNYMVIY